MAILWVREAYASEGADAKDGYTFRVGWTVACDSASDEEFQVLNAPKIPRRGDKHRSGKAVAIRRSAHRLRGEDSPFVWRVEVEFGRPDQESTSGGGLTRKEDLATIEFSQSGDKWVQESDFFGVPIRNSAGDRFASVPEVDESMLKIVISATVPFELVSEQLVSAWRDVVQGGPLPQKFVNDPRPEAVKVGGPAFFGNVAGTVKLVDFGTRTRHDPNATVWEIALTFLARRMWYGAILDEGTRQITNGPWNVSPGQAAAANLETIKPILDANGVPVQRPVFLNGKGLRLEKGKPFWLVYQKHPHGDLNKLLQHFKLPTSTAGYKIKGGPVGPLGDVILPGAGANPNLLGQNQPPPPVQKLKQ